ncbi:phage distal tail protein [Alkalicoccus luteus]|uniref:Phage tail family protein n=1 Tax=Alkalicoccus luteus TaxID=1237094 RepID=A0A969TVB2_9BACI|nr:phage tail domain-containing protein [Alkalicoccus luteus]NJP37927.1 phage tail family protein [Alkalicoccus luteus]
MQYNLEYTNELNQSITFGGDNFKVIFFEGFGNLDADVQTQRSPYQDGGSRKGVVLEQRPLYIEFLLQGESWEDLSSQRQLVSRVFNPKIPGKYTLSYGEKTFEIEGSPESVPYFGQEATNHLQEVSVSVIAPDPYWRDPIEVSRALRAFEGTFQFPLRFPLRFGQRGDSETFDNTGDVAAPVKIDIQGPVEVPQLFNQTTGEFIRVNINLRGGDILHIDTDENHKRVEIYRRGNVIRAFGFLDRRSDLWKLAPGENVIRYSADRGQRESIVTISYQNRYVGV